MPTFTISMDKKLDDNLRELKGRLHQSSKAETFRMALALLKIAIDGHDKGMKLALTKDDEIKQEIVLPI